MTKERAKTKSTFTGPVFGLLALLVADAALGQAGGSNAMEKGMEIRILIEGTALAATLEDNAASRDFFYRDFRYSRGLIRLGRIDGDVKLLERDGPIAVRIEPVQRQG